MKSDFHEGSFKNGVLRFHLEMIQARKERYDSESSDLMRREGKTRKENERKKGRTSERRRLWDKWVGRVGRGAGGGGKA